MTPNGKRLVHRTCLFVAAMLALRLVTAAVTPLTFDEAYYWMWSKHLARSYYDHPPMVAWLIRLGTMIAGDTEFGVRLVSVLLGAPMSWAVWRAAELLFGGRKVAASATVLLNATIMAAAGTTIVTPDAPLLVASSFVLYALAQVLASGRGAWWLAVGAAIGAALLSKYTALFFGPAILIWLLWVPQLRRWLVSPWPYLGGLVSLAMFTPVILWNADHQWISFIKQMGRARAAGFHPHYLSELIPTQFGLATPFVFVLGAMGLYAMLRGRTGTSAARVLIGAIVWTIAGYFIWHATHNRVEANWLSPIYPAVAVAAAAATLAPWSARDRRIVDICARWAAPAGVAIFVLLVLQANTGLLTGNRRDASVRTVGVGFAEAASEIEAVRARVGATCVVSDDYGTAGWLAFYLPKGSCVAQRSQRYRWIDAPVPEEALLTRMLLVGEPGTAEAPYVRMRNPNIETVGSVVRKRGSLAVETIELNLLQNSIGGPFEGFLPPELR